MSNTLKVKNGKCSVVLAKGTDDQLSFAVPCDTLNVSWDDVVTALENSPVDVKARGAKIGAGGEPDTHIGGATKQASGESNPLDLIAEMRKCLPVGTLKAKAPKAPKANRMANNATVPSGNGATTP